MSTSFSEEEPTECSSPLYLHPEDSGREGHDVVYSAYPGETVILSGAIQATGWTFDSTLGIYTANLGSPCETRQLYVNGTRAERAQTTPYPVAFLPSFQDGGIEYIVTGSNPAAWNDPTTWTNQQNIEAVIITQWKMMRVPVNSVTWDSRHWRPDHYAGTCLDQCKCLLRS